MGKVGNIRGKNKLYRCFGLIPVKPKLVDFITLCILF